MNKYEAMIIIKPDLSEDKRKVLFAQMNDAIAKSQGKITQASVWSEKKKLFFKINKCDEGVYYLMNFSVDPLAIKDIRHIFTLNENILRVLVTRLE